MGRRSGDLATEIELIDAARAGSVAAFTELVRNYRERLLRFLLARTPSHADAEDALQDTLLNAYRYLDSYDPRWRFSTWLYRIAINNAARSFNRVPPDGVHPVDDLADVEADPLRDCVRDSNRANMWLIARQVLNDDVYAAMWLRYVEDQSVRDVATALERSVPWAKVNLMRGRQALERALAEAESVEDKACG